MAGAGFYHATFRDGASGCIHIGLGSDRRAPCLQTFGITEFINAKVLQERGALLTKKIERGRQLLESEKARTAALEASVSDCIYEYLPSAYWHLIGVDLFFADIACYCCDEAAEEQYCEIRCCLSLVWKEASN
ncbi:uncharacterized protein [Triticum aestivum]|uniref:uncharacterized protein n=1 Tax=Triticum aestivum TaxID=4565 RepID=UPI001D008770|nr:uncharacterized protein LOC123083721 [Triticum aestivum]